MFKNLKLGRNHIIAGIFLLIVIVTGVSMLRINYNEGIIDSYEALSKPLYERSKIGMLDSFWQKYTGGTRNTAVTQVDAQRAQQTIDSAYSFMIGADVILLIAGAVLILKPIIAGRNKKQPAPSEDFVDKPRRRRF